MTKGPLVPYNKYTNCVTVGVLATFTFISGQLLGGQPICSLREVRDFYIRRLKRFYPLFLISCVSIYLASLVFHQNGIVSFLQLFYTVTGLIWFVGGSDIPPTLWYFSMMLIFYLITPLINVCKTLYLKVCICCAVFCVIVCLGADSRIFLYFPVYCWGVMSQKQCKPSDECSYKILLGSLFGSLAGTIGCARMDNIFIIYYFVEFFFVLAIIEFSKLISTRCTERIFYFISYSSMCAYLFHRHYFGALDIIFGSFSYFAAYILFFPSLIVLSYFLQYLYDKLLLRLRRSS